MKNTSAYVLPPTLYKPIFIESRANLFDISHVAVAEDTEPVEVVELVLHPTCTNPKYPETRPLYIRIKDAASISAAEDLKVAILCHG